MALAGGSLHSTCVVRCCGAYFSLDAAAFSRCSRPVSPVCCISPLFLKFVHFILKNTLAFSGESSANLGPNQANLWKKFGALPIETLAGAKPRGSGTRGVVCFAHDVCVSAHKRRVHAGLASQAARFGSGVRGKTCGPRDYQSGERYARHRARAARAQGRDKAHRRVAKHLGCESLMR